MGAIDSHNFRRHSGRGTAALEKVFVTRSTKDRIFINVIAWVLVNICLAMKYFVWGGEQMKSSAEIQEAVALALINNQWVTEGRETSPTSDQGEPVNDPEDCAKHPNYNANLCKHCRKRKTVYYCARCSEPRAPKNRRDLGRSSGNNKTQRGGFMHFCKGDCFRDHACGSRSGQFDLSWPKFQIWNLSGAFTHSVTHIYYPDRFAPPPSSPTP